MNALEASAKLDKLNDTLSALSSSILYFKDHVQDNYKARLLDELYKKIEQEAVELKSKLEGLNI